MMRGGKIMDATVNTAASVGDVTRTGELTREDDEVAYGDSGCTGAGKRPEIAGGEKKSAAAFRIIKRKGTAKAKRDKAIEARKPGAAARRSFPSSS